jgi:peptide/nickel transport system substrate-binding protein
MSRIIKFILAFLIFFYNCSSKKELSEISDIREEVPTEGDWVLYRLSAEPTTLNPITATDVYESIVNGYIYETLIERDKESLKLKPLLAYKWVVSKDKLKYTFYIRKGIKWHDGEELTADDVIFSFQKIKDPKVDAPHLRNYYKDVEKVEKIDKYTVKFTYKKPYFLALEFCGGMPIVPKHIFEKGDFNTHPNNRHPIGTGPYIFEKWETGREIVLKRNPNYWKKKPNIKKIIFKIITDDTVALQLLKREDLDLTGLRPIQFVRQTESKKFKKRFKKLKFYTPNYYYIGWNLRKPYFKDRRVREALTHLIDRETILNNILFGLGKITTGPFYYFSDAYDKDIKPYEYNPEKAKELLKEAGWIDSNNDGILDKDGIDFKFTFLISSASKFAEQLGIIIKEEFKKVGIIVEIKKLEWATFIQQIDERKFDAVTLGWSMGVEQDPYQIWHSSQAEQGSNFVGFKNKRVDELIEKARTEFNPEKRNKMFKEIHRIIHYEQPYTFLFCSMGLVALHKRFQNTKVYNIRPGFDITDWYVPKNLQKFF